MANGTVSAGILVLLVSTQALSNAAWRAAPRYAEFIPSGTTQVQRPGADFTDELRGSCNYTARARKPVATISTDGVPQPVACWAHPRNSGLRTKY